MIDLFNYARRKSLEVRVGAAPLGGEHPIRIQSMTNRSTMDTAACVRQAVRIIEAGGDYVRLTAQGTREAENLKQINAGIRAAGYDTPLIADVHFNPHVAEVAAHYAEAVRINPGNYVDPGRTFKRLDYTDEEYAREIEKIRTRLLLFIRLCKENRTAVRIGVNHGSLSDRILSRYGDTPAGMVESCMEFLRIFVEAHFGEVVVSIKASNTVIMVRTVRLLVKRMEEEGMHFPLHLGVTEAGSGEDGRIKSAVGIGALLADGLGDTIRVSLSEAPEAEIPVALKLRDYMVGREGHPYIPAKEADAFDYLNPSRRKTIPVQDIGGDRQPVVISERIAGDRREFHASFRPDYIYYGRQLPADRDETVSAIVDADGWPPDRPQVYPAFTPDHLIALHYCTADLKFLFLSYMALGEEVLAALRRHREVVIIAQSDHPNRVGEFRALVHELMNEGLTNPVVFFQHYREQEAEDLQIKAAADMGVLMIDGLCDGLFLFNQGAVPRSAVDEIAFGILQGGRLRISKTEYISCPGCGRTLYNLEETVAKIRAATSHLRGLKIGIMGCVVNGPGEMADADYGYVGAGRGKVSLYRKKVCVEKNIPQEEAVEKLLRLIRKDTSL